MNRREVLLAGGAAIAMPGGLALAQAPKDVTVGILFPLSGAGAQVGIDARHAIDTALDIINNPHPDLDLPLAKGSGLPGLGGAKIRVIAADHQSDPQKGRSEAERLITQENVPAIIGSYQSAVAATISQTSERYQVPYLAADNSAPSLTRRGLKYIFRPGAQDEMFSGAMFDFLDGLKKKGQKVEKIALFAEDTIFGTDSATVQRKLAADRGYKIVADIKYRANSPSLTAEVQQLKAANADVLLPSSYTTDGILLVKTMGELGYKPNAILAQDAGFSEKALYDAVGQQIIGCMTRGSFSLDLATKRPMVATVNEMYKKRSGKDFSDLSSREFMAMIVLAEAIDRAKSAEGAKIRDALAATDIPGDRTIMPWARVKFDETGQNTFANPVLLQWTGEKFVTIYPEEAAVAAAKYPMAKG
jgi:branched-chain amino acid transport system substrate-binding protein